MFFVILTELDGGIAGRKDRKNESSFSFFLTCSMQRIKTRQEISPVSLGTEGKRGEEEGKGG